MLKQKVRDWQIDELGDIFIFQNKTGRKAGEGLGGGKYKFFTSSSKQTKFIKECDFDGEYLIFATGGQAGIHYCKGKFSASNDCFVVKINDKILTKYIYYYLSAKIYLLEEGFLGAGLRHVSKDYIKKIRIKYHKNEEAQQKIVSILEKAENLKDRRKKSNGETNKIIQSIFYGMFGGYLKDKKKFKKIEDFVSKDKNAIKAGPFGSSLKKECYVKKGYKIYGQEQVIKDDLTFGDYYISEEKYRELENYKVQEGDILISLVGTYGKISIIPKIFQPGIINPRLMKITLDKGKMNPMFFKFLFLSNAILRELENNSHGGTMNIVNVGIIKRIDFPLPPIQLQNQFAKHVQKIEKIKQHQQKSEQEINTLFDALMQKAFKGELVKNGK